MTAHDLAGALVFAALTGLCAAAALLSLAAISWWAPVFAGCAWLCAECYWLAVDGS